MAPTETPRTSTTTSLIPTQIRVTSHYRSLSTSARPPRSKHTINQLPARRHYHCTPRSRHGHYLSGSSGHRRDVHNCGTAPDANHGPAACSCSVRAMSKTNQQPHVLSRKIQPTTCRPHRTMSQSQPQRIPPPNNDDVSRDDHNDRPAPNGDAPSTVTTRLTCRSPSRHDLIATQSHVLLNSDVNPVPDSTDRNQHNAFVEDAFSPDDVEFISPKTTS